MVRRKRTESLVQGMSLVEVMVALGITAFGMVVCLGVMTSVLRLSQAAYDNSIASLTARSAMNFVLVNEVNVVYDENGNEVIDKYGYYVNGGTRDATKTADCDLDGDGKVGRHEDLMAHPGVYRYLNQTKDTSQHQDYNGYRVGYQLEAMLDNSVKPDLPFVKSPYAYPNDFPEDLQSLRVKNEGAAGTHESRFLIPPFMR